MRYLPKEIVVSPLSLHASRTVIQWRSTFSSITTIKDWIFMRNNTNRFSDRVEVYSTSLINNASFAHLRKPACYLIENINDGTTYVGSTKDIADRVRKHRYMLINGNHSNKKLQEHFDEATDKEVFIVYAAIYPNKEEAVEREQLILDEGYGHPCLLNIAYDARNPFSGTDKRLISDKLKLHNSQPHIREKTAARTRELWKNDTIRNKILSKIGEKITVDGVEYLSVREASRKTGFSVEAIRNALKEGAVNSREIGRQKRKISADGVIFESLTVASKAYGIKDNTMHYRVNSTRPQWINFFYIEE